MTSSKKQSSPGLLSVKTLEFLKELGTEITADPGEVVIRRGDPGRFFYVVLGGELEIRLEGREGHRLPICRLEPGASFGELSVLRREPVTADVVATSPSRLLAYPARDFHRAVAECESLRTELLARLAQNLDRTTADAWVFFKRAQTLSTLVRGETPSEGLVASSGPMKAIHKKVPELGAERRPVLISGEPGTGKVLTARLLHDASGRPQAPLIVVPCQDLPGNEASAVLVGTGRIRTDGDATAGIGYGLLHLAHGGTLVLRDINTLQKVEQALLGRQVEDIRSSSEQPFPDVFLVALSGDGDKDLHPDLRRQFSHQIVLPPLEKRRRDILPLARQFLDEAEGSQELSLTTTGEHALVSMKYRQHNVKELKDVVELAARCADGSEIRAEHIFSGLGDDSAPVGIDLRRNHLLRALLRPGVVSALQGAVLASFAASILLCLMASESTVAQVANTIVWSLWEPVVFGLFFVAGAVWCTVCPLSTGARLTKRLLSLERPPPPWLRTWGIWFAVSGFFLIVWSERVFRMTENPWGTGLLLLILITTPAVLGAIFQREIWCRYLCPLGKLAAVLSPSALLSVGARRTICTSSCSTVECYKGSADVPGCPTFHHPQQISEAYHCKLCLNCLKSCPHSSATLYLRPPVQGLWKLSPQASTLLPLALAVFLLAPVLLASHRIPWVSDPLGLTLTGLLAVGLSVALGRALPNLLSVDGESDPTTVTRVGFSLVALGWGPLMAYQAGNIPLLKTLEVSAEKGSLVWQLLPADFPVLVPVQAAFILLAATVAFVALPRIRSLSQQGGGDASPAGWRIVLIGCAVYVLGCLALLF